MIFDVAQKVFYFAPLPKICDNGLFLPFLVILVWCDVKVYYLIASNFSANLNSVILYVWFCH